MIDRPLFPGGIVVIIPRRCAAHAVHFPSLDLFPVGLQPLKNYESSYQNTKFHTAMDQTFIDNDLDDVNNELTNLTVKLESLKLKDEANPAKESNGDSSSVASNSETALVCGLIYDERMCAHEEEGHPECPERISTIYRQLEHEGLAAQCVRIAAREASDEEILSVHSDGWLNESKEISAMKTQRELKSAELRFNSIFLNRHSVSCARLSAGSTVEMTLRVAQRQLSSGLCVVRPPGHHAESHCAMGFCLFNNVAMAVKVALDVAQLSRVFVLDWDVHHGNGTQNMFLDDPRVLFYSVHRFDHGTFYPCSTDASPKEVGKGPGSGYTVNVGWNTDMMGDLHYALATEEVVMPILEQFRPELIVVSAGFDAAKHDPLGGCDVSPKGYARMLRRVQSLCPRIVVVLEGGYNLASISKSFAACTRVLLQGPRVISSLSSSRSSSPPSAATSTDKKIIISPQSAKSEAFWRKEGKSQCKNASRLRRLHSAVTSVNQTRRSHAHYWPALREPVLPERWGFDAEAAAKLNLTLPRASVPDRAASNVTSGDVSSKNNESIISRFLNMASAPFRVGNVLPEALPAASADLAPVKNDDPNPPLPYCSNN
jgi:acetoin utilization deacetylase AcuC-like enzyme